jgi:hypothetical protein
MKKLGALFFLAISISLFSQEDVEIKWTESIDDVGVDGYHIWVDAEYSGTTNDTTFILTLDPGKHAVAVSAFDIAGNESKKSVTMLIEIKDDVDDPLDPEDLFIVYPNPTNGDFRIRFARNMKNDFIVQILGVTGRIHYKQVISPLYQDEEVVFNIQDLLEDGMYIVAVIENNQRIGYKHLMVVKQKYVLTKVTEDVRTGDYLYRHSDW